MTEKRQRLLQISPSFTKESGRKKDWSELKAEDRMQ
jgi:hypothetical protein